MLTASSPEMEVRLLSAFRNTDHFRNLTEDKSRKTQQSQGDLSRQAETGSVKWYNVERKFGFLQTESGDLFVHESAVKNYGLDVLEEGQKVTFVRGPGRKAEKEAVKTIISVN